MHTKAIFDEADPGPALNIELIMFGVLTFGCVPTTPLIKLNFGNLHLCFSRFWSRTSACV